MITTIDVPLLDPFTLAQLKLHPEIGNRDSHFDKAVGELHDGRENLPKALEYIKIAVRSHDPRARYLLGVWHLFGIHPQVPRSNKAAARMLELAAKDLLPDACYLYAKLLRDGCGVQKNQRNAFKYFLNAALSGHMESMYEVAVHYESGIGVKQDKPVSYIWRGHANSLYRAL